MKTSSDISVPFAVQLKPQWSQCILHLVHPDFERFLLLAVACPVSDGDGKVCVITNGKIKERAMMIACLTKNEVIAGELSQDPFHEDIDEETVEAFQKIKAIRNVTMSYYGDWKDPVLAGREIKRRNFRGKRKAEDCLCEGPIVKPDGTIKQCGCFRSTVIGNVFSGITAPFVSGECYKSEEFQRTIMEEKNEVVS